MTPWYELAMNPDAVTRLYSVPLPLADSTLFEFVLRRDGPVAHLRLHLSRYPDRQPANWRRHGYNAVQMALGLWGLVDVEIFRWSTDNVVDIQMDRTESGLVRVLVDGPTCGMRLTAQFLRIADVTGYVREDVAPPPTPS